MGRHRDDEQQDGVTVAELLSKITPDGYTGLHRREPADRPHQTDAAAMAH